MQILQRALEHPLIEALSWSLLHFLWQGAVVSGLLALILVAFRRASSHARYVVLCSGLTVMALCPVVTWVYSVTSAQARHAEHGSHLTVVSAPIPMPSTPAPSAQLQRVAVDSVRPNAASEPGPRMEQMPNPEGLTVSQDTVARDHDQAKLNIAVDLPARSHSPLVALDQLQVRLAPALPWLVIAWLTGVILLSVRMMVGWRDVQMLKQRATQSASQVWQDRMQRLAKLLRVEKPVRLVESALVFVPTVIGWLRPMILVPASAMTGLNPNQLEALLAHELAHIRRNDFLINLIQTVIETLLFYHPAVWWLSQRIRTEREHCCDDIAVQVCENSVIYARALATMEELRGRPTLTMAADGGSLLARIRRLICPTPEIRRPVWGASCITLVTVVSIGMAAYFTSRVNAAAETPESTLPTTALTVARLPGNIEVELTSVGFHPAKDRVRWTASGEKFGAISHQESELSVLAGTPDQADCREFQFKVTGLPPDHGVKMDYGTTASASSSLYERDRWIGNGAAGPFKSKSTTIRMSIATEPFGRKVVIDLQGKKLDPPEFTPEVQKLHNLLVPLKIVSAEESTELLLESQQLNALEQRAGYVILAIDVAGNEHRSTTTSTTTTSTIASGERQLLFPVPLGSLEQFEYRLRPFRHRVTFENVSLQPGQPTEVLVKTETLPEEQYQEAPAAILERSQLAKQLVTEISIASKKFSAGRMQAEIQNLTDSSRSTTARGPMAPVASALVTWLSDGQRWRINYAEELAQRGSNAAILENWSSGFDGGRNFNWDEQSNQMTIGSARGQNSRRYEPRNLFWYPLSGRIDSLLRAIAQPGTRFVKATRTGMEGYRIEFSDPQAASRRWTAFVCPQRSHLILHYQLFVDERLQWESQVSELAELEPDLWYPKSFRHVSYSWGGGGKYTRKQQRDFKVSLLQRQPEPAISKDEFALKAQVGTNVNDLTVGQEYYNDVWWSELAPYIRRELNWPKTSLSSLNYLTTSFARPIATPALPDTAEDAAIEIGAVANHAVDPPWVNSQPLTWELLNGKVTLIVFWSQVHAESIEILAALRRLHEMYAPHGLQIIAIHEPDEPGVRQTVSGLNLPFLVIADREDQSEKGVLFNQFGLRGVPTAVFVDHQHKLHPIVNAREIPKQLDELLTAAGAKDLPIAKLREELSPVQIMTVQSLWEVLVDEAPKTASIIGRVVDAVNEPIADVQIDVQLNLRLRNASSGDAILKSNQGMHRVLSDAQGQFVITQLPKGQYDLRATFTDRVPLRQSLTVSEGSEQKVTIALTLPDFVEGRVVGGNSVPIADALLKIRYQHPALNNLDYHTEILTDRPTVKTDSNGRFRFEKLDPAAVTIDVFADGYRSAIIRKVALGGSDVEIKMQLANQPEPAPAANDKAAERTPAAKPDRPANADDAQQGEQLKNPTPPLEFRIAAPAKVKEDDSVRWFPILAVKATRPEPTRDLGLPVTREEQYVCQALLANTSEHALLWDK
jgi:beta-lactamase regulating signal transducer with metallopeptidase domain